MDFGMIPPTGFQSGFRESFHIQTLSDPRRMKARTLGHNGMRWPATSTSGRITNRTNCAMDISPNIVPATRKPSICGFIMVSISL
jgi:hypothetical protein